eukprot:m.7321 g.7321  ORF g.7321 m.7321 type:complete len:242 (+) comp18390_c0_seq1:2345-3070(+)
MEPEGNEDWVKSKGVSSRSGNTPFPASSKTFGNHKRFHLATPDVLTPPLSDSKGYATPKRVQEGLRPPILDFGLLTPPDDILPRCDYVGILDYAILDQILRLLKPWDILQFAAVSKRWKRAVEGNKWARTQCREFLKKVQKENLPSFSSKENQKSSLPSPFPNRIQNETRPCPACFSPSRQSPGQFRSQCTCCNFDFCHRCFQPWHSKHRECDRQPDEVSKKLSTDGGIGSRATKKRLKRL